MARKKDKYEDMDTGEFLELIIPKIAKGIQDKKIKLKSMGITNAEDLRLRKYKKIINMEGDLLFVAFFLLQRVIYASLLDSLEYTYKNSKKLIIYKKGCDIKKDIEETVLSTWYGDNAESFVYCLNISCAVDGITTDEFYETLLENKTIKNLQTKEGMEAWLDTTLGLG